MSGLGCRVEVQGNKAQNWCRVGVWAKGSGFYGVSFLRGRQ